MKQNLNSYITRLTQRGHGWGLVSYKYDGTVKIFGPIHFQNIGQITKFFFFNGGRGLFSTFNIYKITKLWKLPCTWLKMKFFLRSGFMVAKVKTSRQLDKIFTPLFYIKSNPQVIMRNSALASLCKIYEVQMPLLLNGNKLSEWMRNNLNEAGVRCWLRVSQNFFVKYGTVSYDWQSPPNLSVTIFGNWNE